MKEFFNDGSVFSMDNPETLIGKSALDIKNDAKKKKDIEDEGKNADNDDEKNAPDDYDGPKNSKKMNLIARLKALGMNANVADFFGEEEMTKI
eukprot:CAMPEP_0119041282 /NCGR_PEP_ID=MMETSP1177-20130426/11488_1 /TAXON_ID=2985 /ORGANISM="Ochromonas sp, Strain CCMP1899" /LENGTH=92 /DNA_ID=CAMNT_0007007191 /DNA_START=540 /DNA_END=819 /DNA_ORIENTATION=-